MDRDKTPLISHRPLLPAAAGEPKAVAEEGWHTEREREMVTGKMAHREVGDGRA